MTIRITTIAEPRGALVKVVGRLHCDDFDELVRTVQRFGGQVALDLTELQSVDRATAPQLRAFIGRGVEVRFASPYVKLLLETDSQRDR